MKYMGALLLLFIALPSQVMGHAINQHEKELMAQISLNCKESLTDFKFPMSDYDLNRAIEDAPVGKFVERDLTELKKTMPDAEQSIISIWGKPFNQRISICKKRIENIRKKLNRAISARPSKDAREKISDALWRCKNGLSYILSKDKHEYKVIESFYNYYIESRNKAILLDKKTVLWKEKEISKCDTIFVPKFLKLKNEKVQENERKKAALKAVENKRQQQLDAIFKTKEKRVKQLGYKGMYTGITTLLDELNQGYSTMKSMNGYLIEPSSSDTFYVSSIVDNYIVYGNYKNSREYVQIAVEKEIGMFYGKDAPLPYGFYKIIGVKEFISVLGAKQQLIVLKKILE